MKGFWIQDQQDTWHLIEIDRDVVIGSETEVATWCGKSVPALTIKKGSLLSFMDICHDECVRRSEEL